MTFAKRVTVEQVEEGNELAPKFDEHGLTVDCPTWVSASGHGPVLEHPLSCTMGHADGDLQGCCHQCQQHIVTLLGCPVCRWDTVVSLFLFLEEGQ